MTLGRICRRAGGIICTSCKATCKLDNQRRSSKSKDHGLTESAWDKKRTAALERDRYLCQLRIDSACTRIATTVHLRPELQGDHRRATLGDLKSSCAHCHGVVDAARSSASGGSG